MSSQSDPRLEQAQRLIEAEQFQDARALLLGILRENPRDTRALFLYALAAANREEAVKVLNRVLELDPLHQQAKNALAQIEGRGLEATPTPPRAVTPDRPVGVGAPRKKSGGYDSSVLLAMAAVVLIIGAAIALLVAVSNPEEEDETPLAEVDATLPTQTPSFTPTATNTPDLIRQATFEAASEATLPAEWTASPTSTTQPSRTPGPPLEIQPSATPFPTFTATQPQVTQINIDLASFTRLFTEYYELSAQVTSIEDSRNLGRIAVALDTIVESIETSNLNSLENDPALIDYAEDFIELLQREQALAEKRAEYFDLQNQLEDADDDARAELTSQFDDAADDVETLQLARLEQLEFVEARLRGITADANATAQFADGINRLRTPTATPIIVNPG
jgi:tetratricopeptide (TPR) repeat protein